MYLPRSNRGRGCAAACQQLNAIIRLALAVSFPAPGSLAASARTLFRTGRTPRFVLAAAVLTTLLAPGPLLAQPMEAIRPAGDRVSLSVDVSPRNRDGKGNSDVALQAAPAQPATAILGAAVPTLGVVAIEGALYRVDGIPGGARLSVLQTASIRAKGDALLASAVSSAWAYATPGATRVMVTPLVQGALPTTIFPGIPVGELALSGDGSTLAVTHQTEPLIVLQPATESSPEKRHAISLGAGRLMALHLDTEGLHLVALRSTSGWMEALAWSSSTNAVQLLTHGTALSAAMRPDGSEIAVFDAETGTLQHFHRGSGGFGLAATQQLPMAPPSAAHSLAAVHFLNGRFVVALIREQAVVLCTLGDGCAQSTLPIPTARAIRPLASQSVLFVESARQGVPSYLLELGEDSPSWHFISRPAPANEPPNRARIPQR
ncbi:MAG: hypothetical protein KIT83_02725 [Bryobacterales bacterium]|nr:hypothetical protein [Bryobacterales bacterium]